MVLSDFVRNKWDHACTTLNIYLACTMHAVVSVNPAYTSCPHLFPTSSLYLSHELHFLGTPSFHDVIPYGAACLYRQELAYAAQTCFLCTISFAPQVITLLEDWGCLILLSGSSQSPCKLGSKLCGSFVACYKVNLTLYISTKYFLCLRNNHSHCFR